MLAAIAWLHLTAAAVWVGSQVFLVLAVVPSLRAVEDPAARWRLLEVLTGRYGAIGWTSLGVLAATGLWRIWPVLSAPELLAETPYGRVLIAKVAMAGGVLLLTALHTFAIGPRLLALTPASAAPPPPEYARVRRLSAIASGLNLLLSLGILWAAALLRVGG